MIPEFKKNRINTKILSKGTCYTIKKEFQANVPYPHQKVIFAMKITDSEIGYFKDLAPNLIFATTKETNIKITEDCIITTTADYYQKESDFLKYYDDTSEKISEFIAEYQEERKQRQSNKNIQKPRRRK